MKLARLVVAAACVLAASAHAQSTADQAPRRTNAANAAAVPTTDGEVRKVDKEQGKLTLKHGRIENLDMPGMTMVFKVADPKLLDIVKPGDKVKFAAANVDGVLTVTAIEPAK